ncbi:MAG TPA: hypothetical protein VMV79_02980 [Alphaproteobacteria bacterium]|nr:hypothetical protein [Alphaproteobacteria bacterium]
MPSRRKAPDAGGDAPSAIANRLREELLRLVFEGDSDHSRIAAIKLLLERDTTEREADDARQRERDEREAAITEARGFLAAFAAAKSASVPEPVPVDSGGAGFASDAGWDSCGTCL